MNLELTGHSLLGNTALRPGDGGDVGKMPAKSASRQLRTGKEQNSCVEQTRASGAGMFGAWGFAG